MLEIAKYHFTESRENGLDAKMPLPHLVAEIT